MTDEIQLNNSDKTIKLNVVSAEESLFTGDVKAVFVTGDIGEMGIMPGHLQLLTQIKPGQVRYVQKDKTQEIIFLSGGILEIQPEVVTILADTAMRAEDIDENAATEAKRRAEKMLSEKGHKDKTDYHQALIEVAEATAKLRAIRDLQKYRQ